MKTISRSKNNRGRNKLILGGVIGLAVVLFLITGLLSKTFYRGMVLLSGATESTGQAASSFGSLFVSKASLEKENTELKKKLAENEVDLADQEILEKENEDLKAAAHFKSDTGHKSVRVLSKPPFTPFDVVVIEGGEQQGIKIGDRVMIGSIYIGVITLVSEDTSRVTLLSSPESNHEAFVGDEALPVLLKGKGGGNFETSLPQGMVVQEGDLVFTYYGNTPLQIGKVSKIISDEDNTLMTILFTLPFNLYSLSHVEIISS